MKNVASTVEQEKAPVSEQPDQNNDHPKPRMDSGKTSSLRRRGELEHVCESLRTVHVDVI